MAQENPKTDITGIDSLQRELNGKIKEMYRNDSINISTIIAQIEYTIRSIEPEAIITKPLRRKKVLEMQKRKRKNALLINQLKSLITIDTVNVRIAPNDSTTSISIYCIPYYVSAQDTLYFVEVGKVYKQFNYNDSIRVIPVGKNLQAIAASNASPVVSTGKSSQNHYFFEYLQITIYRNTK